MFALKKAKVRFTVFGIRTFFRTVHLVMRANPGRIIHPRRKSAHKAMEDMFNNEQ